MVKIETTKSKATTLQAEETEDEDEEVALRVPQFLLETPYLYLVNPEMVGSSIGIIKSIQLKEILPSFYEKLVEVGLDFKILGVAIHSAAKIHKHKVNLALGYERKKEEEHEIRRKRREFDIAIPLEDFLTRPPLEVPFDIPDEDVFFEELLAALKEEEQRLKERAEKAKAKRKPKVRRRRKLEADDLEAIQWEYDLDQTNVRIEDVIEEMYEDVALLSKKSNEVSFEDLIRRQMERHPDIEDKNLVMVRLLLALLYLVRDKRVYAYQDLETYEIFVALEPIGEWVFLLEEEGKEAKR